MTRYDAEHIAEFYDGYADREWERFDDAPGGPANLEIHRRFLHEFIQPGWRVLDAGAGPGRFTIELARLGATVVAADISERQLELHAERVAEAGVEGSVEARVRADIVDLGAFATDSFDAVVCFGGPLSYVLDRADTGMGELVRGHDAERSRPGLGHVAVRCSSSAPRRCDRSGQDVGRRRGARRGDGDRCRVRRDEPRASAEDVPVGSSSKRSCTAAAARSWAQRRRTT